jgi:DNA-binding response OmpR family regulator
VRSKILIADDEPVTRAAVKKVVARRGWDVVVCDNGHDAAAQFDLENPPDVAVLDWMMPGLDGSELCQRLRKKKVRAYLIMLTGRTRPEDLVQALASGADDYSQAVRLERADRAHQGRCARVAAAAAAR